MRVLRLTGILLVLAGAAPAVFPAAAAAARRDPIGCGSVITADTTLSADVTCSADQRAHSAVALTVGASGITLDLGGHAVGGDIVLSSVADVTVRHGAAVAVRVDFGDREHVADLHLNTLFGTHTGIDAAGLYIDGGQHDGVVSIDSSIVDLRNLTVIRADVRLLIGPVTLSDSTLVDSTITLGSWGTRHVRATITDNHLAGGGIWLSGDAVIERNTITGADVGVDIVPISGAPPSSTAELRDNTITGGRIGIRLDDYWFAPSVISGNAVRDAGAAGILLLGEAGPGPPPQVTSVTGNTVAGNGFHSGGLTDRSGRAVDDGVHVDAAAGTPVLLAGNRATGNADYGIEAVPGSVQDGGGNTAAGNPSGCLGVACTAPPALPGAARRPPTGDPFGR